MSQADGAAGPVSMDVDVEDGRTTITLSGEFDAAVVVRSASGERIYLPPEEAAREGTPDSPYRPAGSGETPYDGIQADSPYEAAREAPARLGLTATGDGFRIRHPEPVTDVRFLR
jgi:hypothetical protein